MITLTIDPKKHKGPEEAYLTLQKKRAVVRFVEKLHRRGLVASKEFFYVIEFHKSGWIHYHLAVRGIGVVEDHLLGKRLYPGQDKIADLWGHGIIEVSAPSSDEEHDGDEGYAPEHAMNYLTKYIAKQDQGPPDWVLDRHGNFRKFSTSHGLTKSTRKRSAPNENPKVIAKRTPRERAAQCAKSSRLMSVVKTEIYSDKGVEEVGRKYTFRAEIERPFEQLKSNRNFANEKEELGHWAFLQRVLDGRIWTEDGKVSRLEERSELEENSERIMAVVREACASGGMDGARYRKDEEPGTRPKSGPWNPDYFPRSSKNLWITQGYA